MQQTLVRAQNIGVRYIKINNRKRQELKSLIFNALSGKALKKVEFWALKNIDFEFKAGEIIGIIGANGAGKSTLCRVISQILLPDTGTIDIHGLVSALLSLGTGFNTRLTGTENIFLNGMMLGFSYQQVKKLYPKIVEFSGIEKFIDIPILQYSKGMKSRLGFSIAAMLEPEILILDETLNAGDQEFKEKASGKMEELIKKAKLVVLVSHDLNFISERCSRAIWLEKGNIRQVGDPETICDQYRKEKTPTKKKRLLENYTQSLSNSTTIPAIEISDLAIKYKVKNKDFWALKKIDFTLFQGDILGVIGHNGAGKSTLCKVLSKILKPDRGTVNIYGKTTEILGFGSGFNKELTGSDNIFLNGLLLGIPHKKLVQMYDEIIDFSGLQEVIENPMREYSSGMVSRLGFSIATSIDPEILIIDEALSAGDLAFHEKAATRIQHIMKSAKATIVVTHNMNFVRDVCTRAIWIDNGKLMFDGLPEETIDNYLKKKIITTNQNKESS